MEGKIPHAPNFEDYMSSKGSLQTYTTRREMSSKDGRTIELHRTEIGIDGSFLGKYRIVTIKNGQEDTVVDQIYDGTIPGVKAGNTKNELSLIYSKLNYGRVVFYGTTTKQLNKNLVSFITDDRNYNSKKSLIRIDSHDIPFP